MAWVKFKKKYNWRVPGKGVSFLTFAGGRAYSVKKQCAADAIADGAADAHPAPRRAASPVETPKDAADGAGTSGS